jgi:hypothetical protein
MSWSTWVFCPFRTFPNSRSQLGKSSRQSISSSTFFSILPLGMAGKHTLIYIYIYVFTTVMENLCRYSPEPPCLQMQ